MITAKDAHARAKWATEYRPTDISETMRDICAQIDRDSNGGAFLTEYSLLPGHVPALTRCLLDLGFSVEKEPIPKGSTLLRISWESPEDAPRHETSTLLVCYVS